MVIVTFDRNAYMRTWRKTHKEQYTQQYKRHYQKHKEQLKLKSKEYRDTHKEQIKEYDRTHYQTHKFQYREHYLNNREQLKQNDRERHKKTKIEFIKMLGSKCSKCGYDKCIAGLDFHHLDPKDKEINHECKSKKFEEKIKTGKIILLCSNCHRELHYLLNRA